MEAENKLEEDTQYYMEIKNNYCELNTRILALLKILLLIIPEVQSIIYIHLKYLLKNWHIQPLTEYSWYCSISGTMSDRHSGNGGSELGA